MNSLQRRVTLGIGAVLAAVLVALWFGLGLAARHLAQDYVASRLEHDAESLLTAVAVNADSVALGQAAISPAYLRPYSGHYFVISHGAATLRSRSLWDTEFTSALAVTPGRHQTAGPLDQTLLLVVRRYQRQGQEIVIAVAEDLTPLQQRIDHFQRLLLALLAAALGAALLLQWIAVRRGLAPLERLRADVARLQQGDVAELEARAPSEVAPLVREINHLLTLIGQRLERSRNALGDLAHALKGPLSRLVRAAEDQNSGLDAEARRQLLAETDAIRSLVDRELKRARLAGHARPGQHFAPEEEIPHLLKAIRGIYRDKELDVETHLPARRRRFAVDRDDVLELLGNLLDNAAKWARGRVVISVADEPGLHLVVEDDGPGCSEDDLTQLPARGVRLDERTSGTGLGLSIVRAIVAEYGGTLVLGRSTALGGFRVEVQFPPTR